MHDGYVSLPRVMRVVVVLFTGTGPGKTTAALGIALRALGHRKRVVIVQFIKWWKQTGEYRIAKHLRPQYTIRQFGRKGWIGLRNLTEADRQLALKGLRFAERVLEKNPDVLVLDEINLAVHCGLIKPAELTRLLKRVPRSTVVVLTGRHAPKALMRLADVVVEMVPRKLPRESKPVEGLNF